MVKLVFCPANGSDPPAPKISIGVTCSRRSALILHCLRSAWPNAPCELPSRRGQRVALAPAHLPGCLAGRAYVALMPGSPSFALPIRVGEVASQKADRIGTSCATIRHRLRELHGPLYIAKHLEQHGVRESVWKAFLKCIGIRGQGLVFQIII